MQEIVTSKFSLKLTTLVFWTKFSKKKGISDWKQKKKTVNIHNLDQICPRRALPVKKEKSEQHHWTQHIRISLGNKFYLQLIILNFWTKFTQKKYFHSKTKEVNSITEFCTFEWVQVPNFSFNWKFWLFGPNLPKHGVSSQKKKAWTASLNSAYSN